MKERTMSFVLTNKGRAAMWERGGMLEDTGAAIVVANPDGTRKRAVFIPRELRPCSKHALIYIADNDIIITVKCINKAFQVNVYRIQKNDIRAKKTVLLNIATFDNDKWDDEIVANTYKEVIDSAKEKASTKYCEQAKYCKQS